MNQSILIDAKEIESVLIDGEWYTPDPKTLKVYSEHFVTGELDHNLGKCFSFVDKKTHKPMISQVSRISAVRLK